jgi:hypothetical protein
MVVRKRRANKKAQMVKAFVQIVLFLLLFFVAYKAFTGLMNFWIKDMEQGTIKSMEGLEVEIENMVKDKSEVPIYIDLKHQINGYPSSPDQKMCRGDKSCICICDLDSNCENNAIKKCTAIDVKLAAQFSCTPKKTEEGKAKVFNIVLTKEEDKVRVSCT